VVSECRVIGVGVGVVRIFAMDSSKFQAEFFADHRSRQDPDPCRAIHGNLHITQITTTKLLAHRIHTKST
jgi:hypothetical protein